MRYDSNDISLAEWVKTECKTMVSFKYKSTNLICLVFMLTSFIMFIIAYLQVL